MVKRYSTILFSFVYLLLSAGTYLSVHYCQGKVSSVNLYSSEASCCCGTGEMPRNCCEDEEFYFVLAIDQYIPASTSISFNQPQFGNINYSLPASLSEQGLVKLSGRLYDLPPPPDLSLYLMNCLLLI